MRVTRALVGLSLFVSLLVLQSSTASAAQCWNYHTYETRMAQLTNESREAKGLSTLVLDPELSMAARIHSRDMARQGRTFHSTTDSLDGLLTGRWRMISENVGAGGSAEAMHEMFLNSPTHRENIFKENRNRIGVGTVKKDGRTWVTVLFENGRNLGTTLNRRYCG